MFLSIKNFNPGHRWFYRTIGIDNPLILNCCINFVLMITSALDVAKSHCLSVMTIAWIFLSRHFECTIITNTCEQEELLNWNLLNRCIDVLFNIIREVFLLLFFYGTLHTTTPVCNTVRNTENQRSVVFYSLIA